MLTAPRSIASPVKGIATRRPRGKAPVPEKNGEYTDSHNYGVERGDPEQSVERHNNADRSIDNLDMLAFFASTALPEILYSDPGDALSLILGAATTARAVRHLHEYDEPSRRRCPQHHRRLRCPYATAYRKTEEAASRKPASFCREWTHFVPSELLRLEARPGVRRDDWSRYALLSHPGDGFAIPLLGVMMDTSIANRHTRYYPLPS